MNVAPSMIHASILLTTYQCASFIRETFQSLLDQDYGQVEIIVSDDRSSDGTWELLCEMRDSYRGRHAIRLHQNPVRLGVVGNFMQAFSLSSGQLIFNAGHDDISLPNRVSACVQFWQQTGGQCDLVATDAYDMALDGANLGLKKTDALQEWSVARWFIERPFFFGASFMMRRDLIALAPLKTNLPWEDQVLVFRALLRNGAQHLATPLIFHRRGGLSQRLRLPHIPKTIRLGEAAAREIVEYRQFCRDAKCLGKAALLNQHGSAYIRQRLYLYRLYRSQTWYQLWRLYADNRQLPNSIRRQYFKYYLFPWFVNAADDLKNHVKRLLKPPQ